jgi:hypothetical protein
MLKAHRQKKAVGLDRVMETKFEVPVPASRACILDLINQGGGAGRSTDCVMENRVSNVRVRVASMVFATIPVATRVSDGPEVVFESLLGTVVCGCIRRMLNCP